MIEKKTCFQIVYCDVCIQVFQVSYSHCDCVMYSIWAVFVGAMRVPNKDIMLTCIICISMPSLSCSSVDTRGATLMDREERPRCSQVLDQCITHSCHLTLSSAVTIGQCNDPSGPYSSNASLTNTKSKHHIGYIIPIIVL